MKTRQKIEILTKDLLFTLFDLFTAYSFAVNLVGAINVIWFLTFLRLGRNIFLFIGLAIIAVNASSKDDKTFRKLREAVSFCENYKWWFNLTSLGIYPAIVVCAMNGAFWMATLLAANVFMSHFLLEFIKAI